MKFLSLLMFTLTVSTSFASEPCTKGQWIDHSFLQQNKISIVFNEDVALSGNRLTFLGNRDSKWAAYWGTIVAMIFSHDDGSKLIAAGSVFQVIPQSSFYSEGSLSGSVFNRSNLVVFTVEPNDAGIRDFQFFTQVGSGLKVRRLQNRLPVTLMCEKN